MATMTRAAVPAHLAGLPKSSLLRLYDPASQGNSFSLDGFPTLREGKEWFTRLTEIIELQGAVSMTTNQTLFRQLLETGVLDERLRGFKAQGRSSKEIYQTLYNEAAVQAARLLEPIHARWPWDGRVSQEASALLTEVHPLVEDVQRIARLMQGVGAFTKIPNLGVGPQAIQKAMAGASGGPWMGAAPGPQVHPNITLVFSDRHYIQTVEGYLTGLSARVNNLKRQGLSQEIIRQDLEQIYSVNSLFISRVDRVADPMIEERLKASADPPVRKSLELLKGKVAVAQAKKVYQLFEAVFLGKPFEDPEGLYADEEGKTLVGTIDRLRVLFQSLKSLGANPQRLLIASSGIKSDQPYSPLLYVLPFLGPWTANTMPEGTLEEWSRFVEGLSDGQVASLKNRNLMREPLPKIPTDVKPASQWDRALLMTREERRSAGVEEVTPDQILRDARALVFKPQGTSLRAICDTLRDKGAASFRADEEATLQAIERKLQVL